MAGIKDVAKKAGVGVGTVSRMLNDSGYVADDTRKKIEIAMRELNYTPNELARNLYHKRTGIIAVLVPNVSHPFFSEFVNYAEAELYKIGYKMMLCNTKKADNAELEYLDMLNRHIVDGVITIQCHYRFPYFFIFFHIKRMNPRYNSIDNMAVQHI